jgi:prevent-host-death family protein
MMTVGASDAKTHLSALLKKVSMGEIVRITSRGVPVAKLVPVSYGDTANLSDLVRDIRRFRKGATLGKVTIRALINEGRRY